VDLSWQASTSAVAGYNVYRGAVSGGPYIKVNSSLISGTAYMDTTVLAGQTYYYVATAVDSNNDESAYSTPTSAVVPSP
jgi:fibronectin type 3 domain-containing protein